MTRKSATLIGGTAVILGVGIFAATARSGESAPEGAAAPVNVTAERRDLEVLAEAPGSIEPIRTVEVKSKASGEVLSVHVETGDRVEQGQLLAEIDPRDVQNALDQAVADLESAEVQASTTEANRTRMEELRRTSVVTQQEYEGALQAAASARAAVVRARTNLQLARERRSDVTIRAPIAGTIIADNVEPGQIIASATGNVSGGTILFTMADLSSMQVRTLVDETDIGQIQAGQSAQVTVEAYPGLRFRGEVYKIEPQAVVEQNVTTFPVLVRLANPENLLKPGMNAEVAVEIATRRGVVVVPNGAVVAPRDAASAAAALGLDAGAIVARRVTAGGASGAAPSAGPADAAAGMPAAPAECMAVFERIRAAGGPASISESDQAQMDECRSKMGGGQPGAEGTTDGNRPGLVFVRSPEGVEARPVVLGISDWENTEVVEGLEAGETVLEISGAQLQQAQQQEIDRRQQSGPRMLGPSGPRGWGG